MMRKEGSSIQRTGCSHNEFRLIYDMFVPMRSRIMSFVEKELSGSTPQIILGLPDCGKRRRKDACELNIIIAYQSHIFRDGNPMFDQSPHQPKRQQIVRAKNSRRPCPGTQEPLHTLLTLSGALSLGSDFDNGAFGIKASCFYSSNHSTPAVRNLADTERAMHKADAFMPLFKKMRSSNFAAPHIIHRNRAEILDPAWAVQ